MSKLNLDDLKMGYFLVFKGGDSLISRVIKKEQREVGIEDDDAEFTHVEISGGGPWSIGALWPRSKIINIQKSYRGRFTKVVRYREYGDDNKRYKVSFFGASRCNLPYGWFSGLWFVLNDWFKNLLPWASAKRPFCSLLCAYALKKVYPGSFEDYRTVLPGHFLDDEKFEVVWEGVVE